MNIVGLDLSLTATGWAASDHGTITTSPRDELGARLEVIRSTIHDLTNGSHLVVIEDLPSHVKHGGPQLGMVHGIVRHWFWAHHVPVVLIPPASLKTYATGKGNASKPDIRMAIYQRYGLDIPDDNAADAHVLRAMALDHYGAPLAVLPQTHRRALDKVDWPNLTDQENA